MEAIMSVDRVETGRSAPIGGKIRMTDLARLAGVSVATVSRSLSDSSLINRITKRRVWQIASDHGYVAVRDMPETLHGSLATLALMMPAGGVRFFDPFIQDLLAGIAEAAAEARCDLIISHAASGSRDVAGIMETAKADAFLFFGQKDVHEALTEARTHRFLVWGEARGASYATIGPDNFACGYLGTRHLIAQGCRRIAYLGENDSPDLRERFRGYLKALNEAGQSLDPDLLLSVAEGEGFDGLFCASEARFVSALGLAGRVRLAGVHHGLPPVNAACAACISFDMAAAGRAVVAGLLAVAADVAQPGVKLPVHLNLRK